MFLNKIMSFFIIFLLSQSAIADDKEIALKLLIEENSVLKQQLKQLKNLLGCDDTRISKLNESIKQLSQSIQQQQTDNQQTMKNLVNIIEDKQSNLQQTALSSPTISDSSKVIDSKNATTIARIKVKHEPVKLSIQKKPEPLQKKQLNNNKPVQEDMFSPFKSIKPTTFQLVYETSIINEKLEEQFFWEEGTSFTAKEKHGEYYKISGYFVDKKWVRAPEQLYVAAELSMKK